MSDAINTPIAAIAIGAVAASGRDPGADIAAGELAAIELVKDHRQGWVYSRN
jgi:hypothetical protein